MTLGLLMAAVNAITDSKAKKKQAQAVESAKTSKTQKQALTILKIKTMRKTRLKTAESRRQTPPIRQKIKTKTA